MTDMRGDEIRVIHGWDKKTGHTLVDFPDCPEPYRTMLKDAGNRLAAIQRLVDAQAKDEALWSVPAEGTQRISEAHLQQELRRLHASIEDGR